jgi:hypothetical protein
VTVGVTPSQTDLFVSSATICDGRVGENSIWAVLHREGRQLFADELFSDLFRDQGRRSIPPQIVATVMVLQRLEGLSDREAVDAFDFDVRWKYAAGGLALDYPGFVHTVLVDMRERLRRSDRPNRIFEVGLEAARQAGLIGRRRVLDSTPLYDAVATMDTVTLIRSAIRGLLAAVDDELEKRLRAVLASGDGYESSAKPQIDWNDPAEREALIDSRARDAFACLTLLEGMSLSKEVEQASKLLAVVVGQDLEEGGDGTFRIARRVAKDRIISTVDPEARHGHKTAARGFDGYKGHAAVDPDSEIVTATAVTPGNAGDASVAEELIEDLLAGEERSVSGNEEEEPAARAKVYGDSAYGGGQFQSALEAAGIDSGCKSQGPAPLPGGLFSKDRFEIDLEADTVRCPNGVVVKIERMRDGKGFARFGQTCAACPLRRQCTAASEGRTVQVGVHEATLARARRRQTDPSWSADYRATRPRVERKFAHLMRRKHGGRRTRMRGTVKNDADFRLLAAAANLARMAVLGLRSVGGRWAVGVT